MQLQAQLAPDPSLGLACPLLSVQGMHVLTLPSRSPFFLLTLIAACSGSGTSEQAIDPTVSDYECSVLAEPQRLSEQAWIDSSMALSGDWLWVVRSEERERGSAVVVAPLGQSLEPEESTLDFDEGGASRQPQLVATREGFLMAVESNFDREHHVDIVALDKMGRKVVEPTRIASPGGGEDAIAAGQPVLLDGPNGPIFSHLERRHAREEGLVDFRLHLSWLGEEGKDLVLDWQISDQWTLFLRPQGVARTEKGVAVAWSRAEDEVWSVHAAVASQGAFDIEPMRVSPMGVNATSAAVATLGDQLIVAWRESTDDTEIVVSRIDAKSGALAEPVSLDAEHTPHPLGTYVEQREVNLNPLPGGGILVSWIVDDVAVFPHFPVVVQSTLVHQVIDANLATRSTILSQSGYIPEGVQVELHHELESVADSSGRVHWSLLQRVPETIGSAPVLGAVRCKEIL